MKLADILKKLSPKREYEEIAAEKEEQPKINVKIENLTGLGDVERLIGLLKEGNILFVKSQELQKKDLGQFQQAVNKLSRNCKNFGFDIVGTEDGYLVLTPKFAKIVRS
jgi:SepF-like predicted cell division protein (DUF552 family)